MPSPQAECAKSIRAELKAAYPGVKFSVTSQSFSMSTSVVVEAPEALRGDENLGPILAKYQTFQGTDWYTDSTNWAYNKDLKQASFVHLTFKN
jgi:hypothetical protein